MRNSSKKTPWHLRFAVGLLVLASREVQAQCAEFDPNDCANPCYVESPFENE